MNPLEKHQFLNNLNRDMKNSIFNLLVIISGILIWVLNPWPFESFRDDSVIEYNSIQRSLMTRGGFDPLQRNAENKIKIQKKIFIKYFPDFTERVEYQNRQFEFFQSSKKKLREADRLRLSAYFKSRILTHDEKDALDYFSGTGFYKSHQDLNTPPNLYDTRETFLAKMQDSKMRNNFLKAYKQRNNQSNNL